MNKCKSVLMDEAQISRALKRISHEILEKNGGAENLCLIGIRRRGVPIAKIIGENILQIEGTAVPVGTLDITFYRDDLSVTGDSPVLHNTDIPFDVTGKTVILCDDVLFTGRTVRAGMDALMAMGRPAAIRLAVLIDRGHRELPIRGDYVGKNVPTSKSEYISVQMPPFDRTTAVGLYDREGLDR